MKMLNQPFDLETERRSAEEHLRYEHGTLPTARTAFVGWREKHKGQLAEDIRRLAIPFEEEKEPMTDPRAMEENTATMNSLAGGDHAQLFGAPRVDRLAKMFTWQNELDGRVGKDHAAEQTDRPRKINTLQGLVRACRHECVELEASTPWKWWRSKEAQGYNKQNIKVEIVDLQHFIMSMALALGLDFRGFASLGMTDKHLSPDIDRLRALFSSAANDLDDLVGNSYATLHADEDEQIAMIQYLVAKMQQQLALLLDTTPWENTRHAFLTEDAKKLVGRLEQLNIMLALALGLTDDDFFGAYEKKMAVNHQRQDTGYVVKDEHDCEHI